VSAPAAPTIAPWVIDPTVPGPNLPPSGRSLFDFLITKDVKGKKVYDIPFPFSALVARIESQLYAKEAPSPLKKLLVPVNRSLQRRAGEGAYFTYPRAILTVDTEADPALGHSVMHLKDRLYLGYHEKTGVLEVISYNEAAGRFEFQVVGDYRADSTPHVRYANRTLCMACHQNHSPIFSRPMWDETNVNPKIAALLAHQHRQYHGFPVREGVGVLQAFDDATDRANDISLVQRLWREGCEQDGQPSQSIACRAELVSWALRYALAKGSVPDWHTSNHGQVDPPFFLKAWRTRWPNGLALPNPDIPNRNPFRYVAVSEFPGLSEVEATGLEGREPRSPFRGPYEPTLPREPLEIWVVPETPEGLERVLAGFTQFFTKVDLDRLARILDRRPERLHTAIRGLGEKTLEGRTDVLGNAPFRRVSFLTALDTQLGMPPVVRCCLDDRGMPPPVDEMVEVHLSASPEHERSRVPGINVFQSYCSTCHHGANGFPPNFLHGSPAEVEQNVKQCADRIFVRLSMWKTPHQERLEAPMPPAMHLQRQGISPNQWAMHQDFQVLRKEAAAAVQQKRGTSFAPETLLQQDYDTLPACLAPDREPTHAMGAHHG
jgi:mono/diheme cytochrome c family protein